MAYTNEALGKALEDLTRAYDNFIKNAKDQVVQSLGTEVVDEIKQGANAYVSAQIDEKIETKVSTKFADYYKNGYIQWPGMPSPLEDASLHFEGYSWHEVNYDGNFFRSKGRNAKVFSSVKLTAEQIKSGTYAFGADEQEDAIRNLSDETKVDDLVLWRKNTYSNGLLQLKVTTTQYKYESNNNTSNSNWFTTGSLKFDASEVVPTAEENRSRNLTFVIWALEKDEED